MALKTSIRQQRVTFWIHISVLLVGRHMKLLAPDCLYLLCASLGASIGAVADLRTRRIPNALTFTLVPAGLLLHLVVGGWQQMAWAGVAGLLCGAGFFLFFLVGGMGAGDVKLMAGVACIAGFGPLTELVLATVLLGGMFALAVALTHGRLRSTVANVGALISYHGRFGLVEHPELNLLNKATLRLPYGVAIAAGCWLTLADRALLR
ncbi:MAG: A24 family peptidase [Acidobacteriaceae bacterium]